CAASCPSWEHSATWHWRVSSWPGATRPRRRCWQGLQWLVSLCRQPASWPRGRIARAAVGVTEGSSCTDGGRRCAVQRLDFSGSPEYQSIRARGPVLSGVLDTKTGDIFFGQNTGIPRNLHPALEERLAITWQVAGQAIDRCGVCQLLTKGAASP